MSNKKWGESFLKTGLPLEHLTVMSFTSLGWQCDLHYEYERNNRDGEATWFELDMIAYSPSKDVDGLRFLVECKYHDASRFWFFMPCVTTSHTAQYGALEAGNTVETNNRVFMYFPFQALVAPKSSSALELAPKSVWGVVVGSDGSKQENAIYTAIQQLANGFVPYSLDRFFTFTTNWPTALVPLIVTNAKIFRLRPEVSDLDRIRKSSSPSEIADEINWTWCYFAPQKELLLQNLRQIDNVSAKYKIGHYKAINEQITELWSAPSWVVVANINALKSTVQTIHKHFLLLKKDYRYSKTLTRIMNRKVKEARLRK
jgi:hypothetical protein